MRAPLKTSIDPSQSEKGRDEASKKRVFRGDDNLLIIRLLGRNARQS
jgi:hypothetical protein